MELSYEPDGEVLSAFLLSRGRVNLIQGPWGSGKSTGSVYKLALNASTQVVAPDGYRHRRTYVVRNTFDELKRTTVKTWLDQFPEAKFPGFKWSRPFEHHIRIAPDGNVPGLDWEVVFLALDSDDDRKKLLSAEISDIWFNEFRETDRQLIDDADGRIGRYPAVKDGGCSHPMIVGDTNAPAETHWFAVMSGQVPMPDNLSEDQRAQMTKPEKWKIFLQPAALYEDMDAEGEVTGYQQNPRAENLKWLPPGYYTELVAGKTRSWIRVNILNKPGQLVAGKPVWPRFREETHVAKRVLEAIPGHPILMGVDFGRTPAAVMGQRVFDRWYTLQEFVADNMGAKVFGRQLMGFFGETFPGFKYQMWGDPAGDHMAEADDISPFLMMRAAGWVLFPAPTNDPTVRVGAVEAVLEEMWEGRPRFQLSPACVTLKAAMLGSYHFRKLKVSGDRYTEAPDKNKYSHVADALQYMMIGAGEGRSLLTSGTSSAGGVVHAARPAGVFQRQQSRVVRSARPGVRGFRR